MLHNCVLYMPCASYCARCAELMIEDMVYILALCTTNVFLLFFFFFVAFG